jgi:hypothetical protein
VQGLRAEDEIDIRRAGDDGGAFLAGDAAADADHQVRVFLLQVPDPAEVVEHLLLRLFAHRAGVEQDDVGFLGVLRLDSRQRSLPASTSAILSESYSFIWQPKVKDCSALNCSLALDVSPSRAGGLTSHYILQRNEPFHALALYYEEC